MSLTSEAAEFIREHYSGECWQVTHTDEVDRKVYVAAPRAVVNLSEALAEIQDETGATCDLELTADGATLTFWIPVAWHKSNPSRTNGGRWWHGLALAALAVAVAGTAAAIPVARVHNMTAESGGGAGEEGWGIWG